MKKIILLLVAHACALTLLSQGLVQLGTGAYVNSSGGAYLVFDNVNIVNNGSVQQVAGAGFVKFTGSANVSLSGTGATTIDELLLAKTGASTLSLQSGLSVVSKVNFSGGLLNLNNNVLNLGSTGIFSNESEFSRAFTTGSGYVQASGILNAPSSADLGHLGAVITSPANMGNTVVRRGHAIQNNISGSNNSIRRYYDIAPANNLMLKAVLRFYYFDAELNGIPEANLYQWKSKDNINWDFVGADVRDPSANYVEKKSINKFDRWTLAKATAPTITCPANMTVSANQSGCKASVSFAATATGIPSPTISYSIGTKTITSPNVFSKGTTTVTATASNGILPNATCTFNVTVVCGQSNYTVAQVPGRQEDLLPDKLSISVRPNPSTQHFTLSIKTNDYHPVTVRIVDILGRVVSAWSNISSNSTLSFGDKFLPGVYFVQATQANQVVTLKLVKQAQ